MPTDTEQKSVEVAEVSPSAVETAEGSSDTANITEQLARERSPRTPSPDNDSTVVAGEQPDAGKEETEVETESPDTDKSRIKSRTAKRFGELTDELRDTKGKLSTAEAEKQKIAEDKAKLEEENRAFRSRTLQQIDEPAPAPVQEAGPAEQPVRIASPQPGIDTMKAEVTNLYAQYEQARSEGDTVKAAQIAQAYNAKQSQMERLRDSALLQQIDQRNAQRAQAKRYMGKLIDVHERYPIFQRDEATGSFTQQLDYKSPMMQRAIGIASQDGAGKEQFLGNLLYYLKEAELKMIQAERATDSATLTRTRNHAAELVEKTGLETGRRSAPDMDSSTVPENLSTEQLNELASRQARGK